MAKPFDPTDRRAMFIIVNMLRMPSCSSPIEIADRPLARRAPSHTSASREYPSCARSTTQVMSLRAPIEPSAATKNFGTMNTEMPRCRGGVGRAGQREMHDVVGQVLLAPRDEDLLPGDRHAPVLSGGVTARVVSAPTSCRPVARSGSSCRSTRP